MIVPIYIPISSIGGFPFLHTLLVFPVCGFFDDGYSDWSEVILHCSFDSFSPNNCDAEHLFICLLAICLLWRNVNLDVPPIF